MHPDSNALDTIYNAFNRLEDGRLACEQLPLDQLASEYGSPLYVYSKNAITAAWQRFAKPLVGTDSLICYAVKANSNIAILQHLARLGAGFDVVSVGELKRALKAGGDPAKIIFSGVGKSESEIVFALEQGIHCLNAESSAELERIQQTAARLNITARVSLRVNPDVDPKTHPYISTGLKANKFGIPIDEAQSIYSRASEYSHVQFTGVDFHIGSQISESAPYIEAIDKALVLIDEIARAGVAIEHLDIGGGMGISYQDETPLDPQFIFDYLLPKLKTRGLTLVLEPGRSIVANAGALVTKVEYLKDNGDKHFAIVDAAMNDLIRPALYSAWQRIEVVSTTQEASKMYDIVGPVCESADFLGKDRDLAINAGDCLAIMDAGAYAFGMSSNYNTRARAAEVLIDKDQSWLIRRRETIESLYADEILIEEA